MTIMNNPLIMMAKPCKEVILIEIKDKIRSISETSNLIPTLTVVQVEGNNSSQAYVKNKIEACKTIGIRSSLELLPENSSFGKIEKKIFELNEDERVNGILVQLPIPGMNQVDNSYFSNLVNPIKDVDGFTDENLELLLQGTPRFESCTPKGIMQLLDYYRISTVKKRIVIAGSSRIVGIPLSYMFLNKGDCNVYVQNLETPGSVRDLELKNVDIVIAAIGNPYHFKDPKQFKKGVVLVDVGINPGFQYQGKTILAGDICLDTLRNVASAMTPVPGGIGPMTVTMLMQNTIDAFYLQNSNLKMD